MTLTLIAINAGLAGIVLYGLLWLLASGIGLDRREQRAELQMPASRGTERIAA